MSHSRLHVDVHWTHCHSTEQHWLQLHTHTHITTVHTDTHTHTHIPTHYHARTHAHAHTHTQTHTHTHIHTLQKYIQTHTQPFYSYVDFGLGLGVRGAR